MFSYSLWYGYTKIGKIYDDLLGEYKIIMVRTRNHRQTQTVTPQIKDKCRGKRRTPFSVILRTYVITTSSPVRWRHYSRDINCSLKFQYSSPYNVRYRANIYDRHLLFICILAFQPLLRQKSVSIIIFQQTVDIFNYQPTQTIVHVLGVSSMQITLAHFWTRLVAMNDVCRLWYGGVLAFF